MERTFKIQRIDVVPFNKDNERINMVFIRLEGQPKEHAVGRSFSQFLADLKSSHLVPSTVKTMEHPLVLRKLRELRKGYVSGDIDFQKEGDEYAITENHQAITNPRHELYGKVAVGDKLTVKRDGARVVDGMLTLDINDKVLQMQYNAAAVADLSAEIDSMLDDIGVPKGAENGADGEGSHEYEGEGEGDVPKEVIKAAVGAEEPE